MAKAKVVPTWHYGRVAKPLNWTVAVVQATVKAALLAAVQATDAVDPLSAI